MVRLALPGAIDRPRLRDRLDATTGAGRHAALIAGSGFSNTEHISEWCRDRRVVWLSLDAEDADLDSFINYLKAAFEAALPGFHYEGSGQIEVAGDRQGTVAAISALLADIDDQVEQLVILSLDGFQLAHAGRRRMALDRV